MIGFRPGLHPRRRLRRRILQTLIILFIVWSATETTLVRRNLDAAEWSSPADSEIASGSTTPQHDKRKPSSQRIFIASIHWNNELILRNHWNRALTDLIQTLGPENLFLSVYESGSYDNTKGALIDLDNTLASLAVPRNITLSDTSHWDEIRQPASKKGEGWIETKRARRELRRIPYLARLRNISLQPLIEMAREGVFFDKILFLNDVVFSTQDVLELLDTRGGEYAAACSLDFSHPPEYYDTFALRDLHGDETIMQSWPYFSSSRPRQALERMEPVPVASCWNGIVSMPTAPFLATENPLRFRGIPDSLAQAHIEGSECCLIHADNPLSSSAGVYINPRVRVGYRKEAYDAVHPERKWLSSWGIWRGLWVNRVRRLVGVWGRGIVKRRVREWEEKFGEKERGEFCLVDEMQVLMSYGWAHL